MKTKHTPAPLLDSLGRKNRMLEDRACPICGASFRPIKAASKYCSRPCMYKMNGKNQPNKKDETWWLNSKGYIEGRVWVDDKTQLRVKQHRWVMQNHLGRTLLPEEDVHHRDGNKTNNDISNLEIMLHSEHTLEHHTGTTRGDVARSNISEGAKLRERKKRIEKAAPDLLAALIACDEAMEYISEYDIPLTLPKQVKDAIARATA